MKSFALAPQPTFIAAILLIRANVCAFKLTWLLQSTVAYFNLTRYIDVCKQPSLAGLFGVFFYIIYAGQCSFVDIQPDAPCVAAARPSMDISHDEILRIYENPLPATTQYDVWKLREKLGGNNADYRSRRKETRAVENKLKPYETKADTDNKLKDRPIEYCNDEYCKVSAPKPSDDSEEDCNNTRPPRVLKTNTAFGGTKMPFDKFARHHVGGGVPDCTLTQPLASSQPVRCHEVDTRNAHEGSYEGASTPMIDYYETDDISLKCCGGNVDSAIDYCTCMCCVKGLYYHCTKDACPESALEEPCSCSPVDGGCARRWTALGFCALLFPCLLCYPITRSCTEVCKCYKKQQASMKGRRSRTVQSRDRR